jgi:hypothetical protein
MYLSGGDRALLTYNDIYSNTAGNSAGGVFLYDCNSATSMGNTVRGNSAKFSGGMYIQNSADVVLVNTMVVENRITSAWGAGLRIRDSQTYLLHTTIARNSGGSGEGVYVSHGATVWMTNTILVSQTVGVQVDTGSVALEATLWGEGAWANITETAGSGITTGTLNFRGAPGFADSARGDYHIDPTSKAIDAGLDAGVATDIDGDARPWPSGGAYDIGADELQYSAIYLPLMVRNY